MAMTHSIEGRYPFLDHRVVGFSLPHSPQLKMRVLNEKNLLKELVGQLAPESIRKRHKQPYRTPDSQSFLRGRCLPSMLDYAEGLRAPQAVAAAGLFDPLRVGKLVEKVRAGQVVGMKENMGFVGILSMQLVADSFDQNFPMEKRS